MKRSLLILLLFIISLPIFAQYRWGGGVDYEKIHFGFSFHYVSSSFKTYPGRQSITSPLKGGIGLGLLSNLNLAENSSLRFSPTILFADKQLNYGAGVEKSVKASLLELPLIFKFRSDLRKNYRIYVLGGGKYSHNIVPKSKLDDSGLLNDEKYVKLKPGFFSYKFGLGVDIYFEYFKMSPEIKWSQSFGNVLDKREPNMFNTPIDKLLLRSLQFSLIFE